MKGLREAVDSVLQFREKDLVTRDEWGSINFEDIGSDIDAIFEIAASLKVLPIRSLPQRPAKEIQQKLSLCSDAFGNLDIYKIEQSNHIQAKNKLISTVESYSDSLLEVASPWIPYLAYKQGDVAENIEKLTSTLSEAEVYSNKAKDRIKTKENEIDTIVTQAREASASAGAAVFTQDFLDRSEELEKQATRWLVGTAILGTITLIAALIGWAHVPQNVSAGAIWFNVSAKITILIVLFTATLWCGKIYRILMHQTSENKHKALGLKTFQAFSHAASDDITKDAVLKETTRSIFSNSGSGYVDTRKSRGDGELNIVEVLRTVMNENK